MLLRAVALLLLSLPVLTRVGAGPAAPSDERTPVAATPASWAPAFAPISDTALPALVDAYSLLEAIQPAAGRTSARLLRLPADRLLLALRSAARSRASSVQREHLAFARVLLCARTNLPVSYGNPPPRSAS